jgi:Spy/CpxP family protein refolding chaperone
MKKGLTVRGLLSAMVFAMALAFGSQAALAGQGDGHGGPQAGEMLEKFANELKLTAEQREKLKAHQKKQQEEVVALFKNMAEKQKALKDELEKKDSSKGRLDVLAEDITEIHGKLVRHRIAGVLAVKKILTPQQFDEFLKRARDFQAKRQKGMKPAGK